MDRRENENIVGCKLVFTIRIYELGKLVRSKGRFVARGFIQKY